MVIASPRKRGWRNAGVRGFDGGSSTMNRSPRARTTRRSSFAWMGAVSLAVALAGCVQAPPGASETGSGTTEPSPLPSECPIPDGGECRGELGAGSYSSTQFEPAVTYTVSEGWQNLVDLPGAYLLAAPDITLDALFAGDGYGLGIVADATAATEECEPQPVPALEATPEADPGVPAGEPIRPGQRCRRRRSGRPQRRRLRYSDCRRARVTVPWI